MDVEQFIRNVAIAYQVVNQLSRVEIIEVLKCLITC